jgi:hypothetical protein
MNHKQNAQKKSLTPAGKIALVVGFFLLVGAVGMLVRPLLYNRVTTVEDYAPAVTSVPTNTPRPTITATPAPPTAVPTPQGWVARTDSVNGNKYLAPPPEVEAQIREAFDAVLGCYLIVGDAPVADSEVLAEEWQAVRARADQFSAIEGWEDTEWELWSVDIVPPEHWGPENPVHCDDYDTCTVAQAKTGLWTGAIIYYEEQCQMVGLDTPCLITGNLVGSEEAPYRVYVATIERQEDGIWRVTNWQTEALPEPPSS